MIFAPFGAAFLFAFLAILILIPCLERVKIVGQDMHKPDRPEVPEMGGLAIVAYSIGAATSFLILIAALGALIAFLYYNWYPARILIGDVGTLSIGAIIASAVIIGDFEAAGAIIIIPYFLDFLIKAANRFPSTGW